jgi:hypothetical protein
MTRLALAAALAALVAAPSAHAARYKAVPGPERSEASFLVSYEGSGTYRTTFHGSPPNPGGDPDTNDARDASRQSWRLRYRHPILFPDCATPALDGSNPCAGLTGLSRARGRTVTTGVVRHRHVDGLYRVLNRRVRCRLRSSTRRKRTSEASIAVRYIPESDSFGVTAHNPVFTALSLFPSQCPSQGDSIDRIADFYAGPGFSFADGFGPDRWFTSAEVVIPSSVVHRSSSITMRLADTAAGTPPRRCAVRDPSFERCRTGGSWRGVLTFTARPAATRAASDPVVRPPRSGSRYEGSRESLLQISGRSIEIMAFRFPCGDTVGRTSLNGIRLRRTPRGYRFHIDAHGSVTYGDDVPDENAALHVGGRFSRNARTVRGLLRVRTPRCGGTGRLRWRAARVAR